MGRIVLLQLRRHRSAMDPSCCSHLQGGGQRPPPWLQLEQRRLSAPSCIRPASNCAVLDVTYGAEAALPQSGSRAIGIGLESYVCIGRAAILSLTGSSWTWLPAYHAGKCELVCIPWCETPCQLGKALNLSRLPNACCAAHTPSHPPLR